MQTILKGLLVLFGLSTSMVSADFLGDTDDTYVGFQFTTSLGVKSGELFSGQHQYSYLLLEQHDGVKDGIALTFDSNGMQTLSYIRPSTTFDPGQSRVLDYVVPVLRLEAQDSTGTDKGSNAGSPTGIVVAGLVALAVSYKIKNDLEKDWEPDD